jgi:hypothetical protein
VWVGDRDAVLGVGSVETAVNQGSEAKEVVGQIVVGEDVRTHTRVVSWIRVWGMGR